MRNSRFKAMSVSDAAAERVKEIVAAADKPIVGVRVGVKNGGCAGMSYTMEFAEAVAANDEVVEDKGVKLLIDPKALLFLLGSEMDFKVDKLAASFVFRNPTRLGLRLRRERGDHAGFARGARRRRGLSGRWSAKSSKSCSRPLQPFRFAACSVATASISTACASPFRLAATST